MSVGVSTFWMFLLLAIIRVILVIIALIVICVFACFYSLLRPFHRNNVYHTARYLAKISYLLGLNIEVRLPDSVKNIGPVVYIANHQNIFDVFTVSKAVRPATVSVGKKSLAWVPFFGQMYWLTGNILIDRKNTNKAMNTINLTVDKIKQSKLSIWLFPEGTRSKGRGLLPFKTGAFRTAAQASVPIVPICISNLHKKIKLNRWNNGQVIIEFLPPIEVVEQKREYLRNIANTAHQQMKEKIALLSEEAENINN